MSWAMLDARPSDTDSTFRMRKWWSNKWPYCRYISILTFPHQPALQSLYILHEVVMARFNKAAADRPTRRQLGNTGMTVTAANLGGENWRHGFISIKWCPLAGWAEAFQCHRTKASNHIPSHIVYRKCYDIYVGTVLRVSLKVHIIPLCRQNINWCECCLACLYLPWMIGRYTFTWVIIWQKKKKVHENLLYCRSSRWEK